MKNLILILLILSASFVFAAEQLKKESIKTSAVCGTCKKTIEGELGKVEGIKKVTLDLDRNEVDVEFDEKVISKEVIKEKLTDIGYDADDLKRSKKAYKKLPKCCQSDKKH